MKWRLPLLELVPLDRLSLVSVAVLFRVHIVSSVHSVTKKTRPMQWGAPCLMPLTGTVAVPSVNGLAGRVCFGVCAEFVATGAGGAGAEAANAALAAFLAFQAASFSRLIFCFSSSSSRLLFSASSALLVDGACVVVAGAGEGVEGAVENVETKLGFAGSS